MRARVLDAIYKKIEENPEDKHLQKQIILLSKSSICTIDSFCLDVIKNNFYEIGLAPNTKIAENTEIQILKQETLENLFEEKYEQGEENFTTLVNMYTSYKGDEALKEIIFKIHTFIQSTPYPEKWLEEKIQNFNIEKTSFETTTWGKIIFEKAKGELENIKLRLEQELENIKYEEDTQKLIITLSSDIDKIDNVYKGKTWDELYNRNHRPKTRNTKKRQKRIARNKRKSKKTKRKGKKRNRKNKYSAHVSIR